MRLAAVLLAVAGVLLPAAPARADTIAVHGEVRVLRQGPSTARDVLVLMPGTSAGAGMMAPVGADLVRRLPGWQVWSVDRRENRLEDHSVLDRALAGRATPRQLFDFYLGWLADQSISPHYVPPGTDRTDAAREWGMRRTVADLRPVVRAARRRGGKVVLGGHSLGATIATAYATWDFAGRAGGAELDALLLVDGGSGGRPALTEAEAEQGLERLRTGSPFLDLSGTGVPWALGLFAAVGATAAREAPDALSVFDGFPLLPAELRPPVPVTNAAALGHTLDTETAPDRLELVQLHAGGLAASGDPRPWRDGGLVPIARAAAIFARPVLDGASWFHPARLSLDAGAVNNGARTAAQAVLGLRTTRGAQLRLPLYAFQTSLSDGRVLRGARALARRSRPPFTRFVDRASSTAHLDPLAAAPARNDFLRTVVPFLRRVAGR